jgi:hypothetical protein
LEQEKVKNNGADYENTLCFWCIERQGSELYGIKNRIVASKPHFSYSISSNRGWYYWYVVRAVLVEKTGSLDPLSHTMNLYSAPYHTCEALMYPSG